MDTLTFSAEYYILTLTKNRPIRVRTPCLLEQARPFAVTQRIRFGARIFRLCLRRAGLFLGSSFSAPARLSVPALGVTTRIIEIMMA